MQGPPTCAPGFPALNWKYRIYFENTQVNVIDISHGRAAILDQGCFLIQTNDSALFRKND